MKAAYSLILLILFFSAIPSLYALDERIFEAGVKKYSEAKDEIGFAKLHSLKLAALLFQAADPSSQNSALLTNQAKSWLEAERPEKALQAAVKALELDSELSLAKDIAEKAAKALGVEMKLELAPSVKGLKSLSNWALLVSAMVLLGSAFLSLKNKKMAKYMAMASALIALASGFGLLALKAMQPPEYFVLQVNSRGYKAPTKAASEALKEDLKPGQQFKVEAKREGWVRLSIIREEQGKKIRTLFWMPL